MVLTDQVNVAHEARAKVLKVLSALALYSDVDKDVNLVTALRYTDDVADGIMIAEAFEALTACSDDAFTELVALYPLQEDLRLQGSVEYGVCAHTTENRMVVIIKKMINDYQRR